MVFNRHATKKCYYAVTETILVVGSYIINYVNDKPKFVPESNKTSVINHLKTELATSAMLPTISVANMVVVLYK